MEIEQKLGDIGRPNLRLQVLEINKSSSQRLDLRTKDIEPNQEPGEIQAIVEGVWAQSHIKENAIIHLVNPIYDKRAKTYSINNNSGFLVIEPDNLLTCTLVASTLFCERKTWLNNVFLGQVGTNRAMLVGTLVHEVFQYGVRNRCADLDKLIQFLDSLLDDATVMLEIYSVELHLRDVRAEALSYLNSVKEWVEKYMLAGPRYPLTNDSDVEVKVIGVSDIEENVWSTKYGLKGKIDVTGAVRVYDKRTRTLKDKTLPLELKTGNPNLSSSHAAQVSLYSMMIEDRYAETNQGLVVYLKNKAAMHNITLTHNIKRDLIQRRNELNHHLKNYYYGPGMLDQPRMCKNCDRLTECIMMSKLYEGDLNQYSGMMSLESEAVGHLDEEFERFFKRYHEKLTVLLTKTQLDPKDGNHSKGSFWTYTSQEAETTGMGFGKLQASPQDNLIIFKRHPNCKENILGENKIEPNGTQPATKKLKIQDYFKPKKLNNEIDHQRLRPFDTTMNFSRCRVAISLDCDNISMDTKNSTTALAIGFIQEVTEDQVIMKLYEGSTEAFKTDFIYRLDKIEKRTNLDIERIALVRLLAREDWRCDRVRQLLLNSEYKSTENININLFVLDTGFEEISELDADSQKVVVNAISTDNYFVISERHLPSKPRIHRIISVLTKVICSLDRTILIVAPTMDQLCDLMKILQQKKIRFILVDDGKSNKARFTYASNLVKVPQKDNIDLVKKFDLYIRQHEITPVVITTYPMAIGGLQFSRRTFDYCVAYDCDKTELLVSLAPMFISDRHIILDMSENCNGDNDSNKDEVIVMDGDPPKKETVSNKTGHDISLGQHLKTLRPTRS